MARKDKRSEQANEVIAKIRAKKNARRKKRKALNKQKREAAVVH